MKQLFSAYPSGLAGAALLLFRCALALFVATAGTGIFSQLPRSAVILDLLALSLAIGFSTRLVAALAALAGIVILLCGSCAAPALLLSHALDAVALALIGPGAFSIDARRFGRSTIRLPR